MERSMTCPNCLHDAPHVGDGCQHDDRWSGRCPCSITDVADAIATWDDGPATGRRVAA